MKKIVLLLILLAMTACDLGLESNLDDLSNEKFVNNRRKAREAEISPLLGTYQGELYTATGQLVSKKLVVHIFKDTERIIVDGKANFLVHPKAMIYLAERSGLPDALRIAEVFYSMETNDISLSSDPGSATQFGLFQALGTFKGNSIYFHEIFDHNGPLKPLTLKRLEEDLFTNSTKTEK